MTIEFMLDVFDTLLYWCIRFWNYICNYVYGIIAGLVVLSIIINLFEVIRGGESGTPNTNYKSFKMKGIKY